MFAKQHLNDLDLKFNGINGEIRAVILQIYHMSNGLTSKIHTHIRLPNFQGCWGKVKK